jgi:hypothetical protein
MGHGLVIADGIAALIQVEARNAEPSTPERKASWLTSAITKVIKRAKGSSQHLAHRRENLTSARGGALRLMVDHLNGLLLSSSSTRRRFE